jgi:hypothetical protein
MKLRFRVSALPVILTLALSSAAASTPPAPGNSSAVPPDYRIAFWYRRADPLASMRHQVYDVRKGEYTPAVAGWLQTMHTTRPDYDAYVVDMRLDSQSADTPRKQLATRILAEYIARGGPYGGLGAGDGQGIYGIGGLPSLYTPRFRPESQTGSGVSTYVRGYGFVSSPGANRIPSYAQPPGGYPWPMPYPYVRPRP